MATRTIPKRKVPVAVAAVAEEAVAEEAAEAVAAVEADDVPMPAAATAAAVTKITAEDKKAYVDIMHALLFDTVTFPHHTHSTTNYLRPAEIQKHIQELVKTITETARWEAFVAVRLSDDDMGYFEFIVSGPAVTPYQNGLYHFSAQLPDCYPLKPPTVLLLSTHNGRLRPNPNLYPCGKVCLSLLGTWAGPGWNAKVSNLSQVIIAIQAQIMVSKPLQNEPGFEKSTYEDIMGYNTCVNYVTAQILYDLVTYPPFAFEEVVSSHFLLKKNELLVQLPRWIRMARLLNPAMSSRYYHTSTYGELAALLAAVTEGLQSRLAEHA